MLSGTAIAASSASAIDGSGVGGARSCSSSAAVDGPRSTKPVRSISSGAMTHPSQPHLRHAARSTCASHHENHAPP